MSKIDKNILMQFFSVIFLFGIIVTPVYAAKQVKGEVPAYVPLQPAPEGVYPNLGNNVQFSDPSHEGQFDASGTLQTEQAGGQLNSAADQRPVLTFAENQKIDSAFRSSSPWTIAVLVLLALFGAVVFVYNRRGGGSGRQ